MNPGVTMRPVASITRVRAVRCASAPAFDPTYSMRSPRIAIASARGFVESPVQMRVAFRMMTSASWQRTDAGSRSRGRPRSRMREICTERAREATYRMRSIGLIRLGIALGSVAACATAGGRSGSAIKTGPVSGSVFVVGGGSMGPELFRKFIELAGGPDAPIVVIPTAQGAASYTQNDGSARLFRAFGAKDVVVMHTADRAIANSDTFVARIKRAGGVWFGGGRHFRLVDSYADRKSN